jgi:dimethylargininase
MIPSMFTRAIVRKPGPDFGLGLTTADLGPPSYPLILEQHAAYVAALRRLGLEIVVLEPAPGFPDAYFVEDPAVVTPEAAVIANPGAPSRRGEENTLEPVLARFRRTVRIQAPATLDGGDVLAAGGRYFVGLSERTNAGGARALGRILEEQGISWTGVPVGAGLHLKSGVNSLGGNALVLNEALAGQAAFAGFDRIVLDPGDEYAANTLWINGHLLMPAGFPRARRKLEALGLPVHELEVSEVRKMDGGLTCMSLRF